jgi:hypothetical protein
MSTPRTKPGKRFRLLFYERIYAIVRWPLWLIVLGLAVIWWRAPFVGFLAPLDDWLLYAAGLCLLLWAALNILQRIAYVQCFPAYFRIQTPLLRLAISYQRIRTVRPVVFKEMHPPSKQPWSQRHFLEPLFGLTGVGVTVSSYPMPLRWLKLLLGRYMFTRDAPGFLFLVDDWMTLSRQIDVYRDLWRDRTSHVGRTAPVSMNPFLRRKEG